MGGAGEEVNLEEKIAITVATTVVECAGRPYVAILGAAFGEFSDFVDGVATKPFVEDEVKEQVVGELRGLNALQGDRYEFRKDSGVYNNTEKNKAKIALHEVKISRYHVIDFQKKYGSILRS